MQKCCKGNKPTRKFEKMIFSCMKIKRPTHGTLVCPTRKSTTNWVWSLTLMFQYHVRHQSVCCPLMVLSGFPYLCARHILGPATQAVIPYCDYQVYITFMSSINTSNCCSKDFHPHCGCDYFMILTHSVKWLVVKIDCIILEIEFIHCILMVEDNYDQSSSLGDYQLFF